MRAAIAAAIALGASVAGADPALAITAEVQGSDLVVDTDAGDSDVRITGGLATSFHVEDRNGREHAGAGCTESGGQILCAPGGVREVVLTLGHGDDRALVATDVPEDLDGQQGNDVIAGGGGDDTIAGGDGDDVLEGGNEGAFPNEPLDGGAGNDTISGGGGGDTIRGGVGEDDLSPGSGQNHLFGEAGGDRFHAGSGLTEMRGGADDDRFLLSNGSGSDTVFGDAGGRDVVDYSDADAPVSVTLHSSGLGADDGDANDGGDDLRDAEVVVGGRGADHLQGTNLADELQGLAGADTLVGLSGDDVLVGGPGPDVLSGGNGLDAASYADRSTRVVAFVSPAAVSGNADDGAPRARDAMDAVEDLVGGGGDDLLVGNDLPNRLDGRQGDDTLRGLGGADRLVDTGPLDHDVLDGGADGDVMSGGVASYATRTQPIRVTMGAGADDGDTTDVNPDGTRDDVLAGADGVIGSPLGDQLTGGSGNDRLDGAGGGDVLDGAKGGDTLIGGPGTDRLGGGPGSDVADYTDHVGAVAVTLDGTANDGSDPDGDGTSTAAEEGDLVGTGVEDLRGGSGDDRLRGNGGHNALHGGPGADRLRGGDNGDVLVGDAGEDDLAGQDGNDLLSSVDGEFDAVDCGDGAQDVAQADLADNDLRGGHPVNFIGCEAFAQAAKDQYPVVHIRPRARLRGHVLRARLHCPRALPRACRGRLDVTRRRGRHHAFAHRRYRIRPGRSRVVAVSLSRREAAGLRHAHRTRLVATEKDTEGEPKLTVQPVRVVAGRPRRR